MTKTSSYVKAPRIEVVLVPEGDKYETWLVLHVPDGKKPNTVKLAGPQERNEAVKSVLAVYTTIGEHHAFPEDDESSSLH